MKRSQILSSAGSAAGMLLLILDSKTAISGASEGLSLCIRTVIPSLFPFLFLSVLLTGSFSGIRIPILRPLGKLLRIPEGAESLLAVGFLGGYPVGAQSVQTAWTQGTLTDGEARRMAVFCNNAGPAFLFGIAFSLFPYRWMSWALWGIQIISAIIVAIVLPGKSERRIRPGTKQTVSVTQAMARSVRIMAGICGWVLIFRVITAFLIRWVGWMLPTVGQAVIIGLLEISNGCIALAELENVGLRFVTFSVFLSFGGLCVWLQTLSAAEGLDLRLYFPGKLLQAAISFSFAALLQSRLPDEDVWHIPVFLPIGILTLVLFLYYLLKKQKISRNPAPAVV